MPLFKDLEGFLKANGVDSSTANQASSKIRLKVQKQTSLSDNELELAGEFLTRVNIRPNSQFQQLKSIITKSEINPRRSSSLGLKLGSKIASKIADKTSAGSAKTGSTGMVDKKVIIGGVLRSGDIRQLAVSIAQS